LKVNWSVSARQRKGYTYSHKSDSKSKLGKVSEHSLKDKWRKENRMYGGAKQKPKNFYDRKLGERSHNQKTIPHQKYSSSLTINTTLQLLLSGTRTLLTLKVHHKYHLPLQRCRTPSTFV